MQTFVSGSFSFLITSETVSRQVSQFPWWTSEVRAWQRLSFLQIWSGLITETCAKKLSVYWSTIERHCIDQTHRVNKTNSLIKEEEIALWRPVFSKEGSESSSCEAPRQLHSGYPHLEDSQRQAWHTYHTIRKLESHELLVLCNKSTSKINNHTLVQVP